MNSMLNPATLGALVPIVALLIPVVAIVGGIVQWWHEESMRHETMRELARNGQPIPPELLQGRHESAGRRLDPVWLSQRWFRTGVILIAVGAGVGLALYVFAPQLSLWAVGAVPFFLGIAYLVFWRVESFKGTEHRPSAKV